MELKNSQWIESNHQTENVQTCLEVLQQSKKRKMISGENMSMDGVRSPLTKLPFIGIGILLEIKVHLILYWYGYNKCYWFKYLLMLYCQMQINFTLRKTKNKRGRSLKGTTWNVPSIVRIQILHVGACMYNTFFKLENNLIYCCFSIKYWRKWWHILGIL